jgi:transketolase
MRKVFQEVTSDLIQTHPELYLLLGDIGVFGFKDAMRRSPNRVLNLGILEQGMVGFAAGLASRGAIPIIHSITPFIIERPLEQIKLDFGYQHLPGKFISVGASYDYTMLGATHHSPADVEIFLSVPGAEVWVPASENDLKKVLQSELPKKSLSYIRLSEQGANLSNFDSNGIKKLRDGSSGVCVAIGPTVDNVLEATEGLDHSVISWTALHNVRELLQLLKTEKSRSIKIVEPFYQGGTAALFAASDSDISIRHIGIPRRFIHRYGTLAQISTFVGMDTHSLRERILI